MTLRGESSVNCVNGQRNTAAIGYGRGPEVDLLATPPKLDQQQIEHSIDSVGLQTLNALSADDVANYVVDWCCDRLMATRDDSVVDIAEPTSSEPEPPRVDELIISSSAPATSDDKSFVIFSSRRKDERRQ